MRILICDDDRNFVDKLKSDINQFFVSLKRSVNIVFRCEDFDNIEHFNYDVIFMDIELKTKDGIELARVAKNLNPDILVIFISNRDDLVFKALSVEMFQFVRKVNYKYDLMIVLRQLIRYFDRSIRTVLIPGQNQSEKIYIKDIEYLLSVGHEVIIKCKDKEVLYKSSLIKAIEYISSDDIVQIQKGLAINMRTIVRKTANKVTCGYGEYIIGRSYKENFKNKYQEYLLR